MVEIGKLYKLVHGRATYHGNKATFVLKNDIILIIGYRAIENQNSIINFISMEGVGLMAIWLPGFERNFKKL